MKFIFILFFVIQCGSALSQNLQVKGVLVDSSINKYLTDVSVVLLSKRDSIILADTRSASNGSFSFNHLKPDQEYFLFFSYPGYVSFAKEIAIPEKGSLLINLAKIYLVSQAVLLKEVVVTSRIRDIRFRGDTLQYNTAEIKLLPNSTVEDLLKVLPGLQVDQNGRITAQGKKIKKVLVDGEEFFSNDPVFVTRNLRAEMIGKVEVYDKKSESAVFTGIDDGVKDKVINLKLKQDKNSGVFGKVEAGSGFGNLNTPYTSQVMVNLFTGKRKFSTYFSSNNIGQSKLGSSEKTQLGVGDETDGYDGKGIPEFSTAGLHFDNKWNKDQSSINGDYYYSIAHVVGDDSNFSKIILPVGAITKTANADFQRDKFEHKANLIYKHNFSNGLNFSLSTIASYSIGSFGEFYFASDKDNAGDFLNKTKSQLSQKNENKRMKLSGLLQKKFKKVGRTVSFSFEGQFNSSNEQQINLSNTEYYNGKVLVDSIRSLDLSKGKDQVNENFDFVLGYSEKLSKSLSLTLSANTLLEYVSDNGLSKRFQNPSVSFDPFFSNIRNDLRRTHVGTVNFNYASEKWIASAGATSGINRLQLKDGITGEFSEKSYGVWKPFGHLQYIMNDNINLNINYKGNTTAPELQQLFPYAFNNVQLVTFSKNLSIKNSFSNHVSFSFESFRSLTKAFTAITASYTSTHNPISMRYDIDASGAYSIQYLNMIGLVSDELDVVGFYSRPLKKLKVQFTTDINTKAGTSFSFVNGGINKLNYRITSAGILLSKNKPEKYDVRVGGTVMYNANVLSEVSKVNKNNFFSFLAKSSIDVYFRSGMQVHSDVDFIQQGKNSFFSDKFNRVMWNVWISKAWVKKQLNIKLSINDLLNANTGFTRAASASTFTENRYLTLRRYLMLSAAWNFTKYKQIK